jgi:hypothetical protein
MTTTKPDRSRPCAEEDAVAKMDTRSAAELLRELNARRDAERRDRHRLGVISLGEDELRRMLDLPPGWTVTGVHAHWAGCTIQVMVHGPELKAVEPCAEVPQLAGSWAAEQLVADGKCFTHWNWSQS